MRPNIVYWLYLALGYLIIKDFLMYLAYFGYFIDGITYSEYPIDFSMFIRYFVIVVILSAAIIGVKRKYPWSRILAVVAIGIGPIINGIALAKFALISHENVNNLIIPVLQYVTIDFLLFFLSYKLYTSEPLKKYLAGNPREVTG